MEKTLVILAGGKSSRMGRDKTFLTVGKKSFLQHLFDQALPLFDRVIISAGSKEHARKIRAHIEADTAEIIPDIHEGIGPMGGLLSVYEQTDAAPFAVIAVDLPFADLRIPAALLHILEQEEAADPAAAPHAVMISLDGVHMEGCAAAYSSHAMACMKAAQQAGNHSLIKAIGTDHIRMIRPEELAHYDPELAQIDLNLALRNLNTPEDLAVLKEQP